MVYKPRMNIVMINVLRSIIFLYWSLNHMIEFMIHSDYFFLHKWSYVSQERPYVCFKPIIVHHLATSVERVRPYHLISHQWYSASTITITAIRMLRIVNLNLHLILYYLEPNLVYYIVTNNHRMKEVIIPLNVIDWSTVLVWNCDSFWINYQRIQIIVVNDRNLLITTMKITIKCLELRIENFDVLLILYVEHVVDVIIRVNDAIIVIINDKPVINFVYRNVVWWYNQIMIVINVIIRSTIVNKIWNFQHWIHVRIHVDLEIARIEIHRSVHTRVHDIICHYYNQLVINKYYDAHLICEILNTVINVIRITVSKILWFKPV